MVNDVNGGVGDERKKSIQTLRKKLTDALGSLRVYIKYLLFDIDSLRRENGQKEKELDTLGNDIRDLEARNKVLVDRIEKLEKNEE